VPQETTNTSLFPVLGIQITDPTVFLETLNSLFIGFNIIKT